MNGVKIAAVGHYAPAGILTNEDLEKTLDTSDEWITTRTGMKRRHIAAPNQATSDLAIAAAQRALEKASLTPSDIDCYIVATATPDYIFPATACIVAAKLGATEKPAFDVEIACSGFIYGLTLSASLIRSGVYSRVMLIGAETLSRIVDRSDRGTAVLFGDGAGAAILESSQENSFLSSELGADGSKPEVLCLLAGGSRHPLTHAALDAGEQFIQLEGREVFKFAVTKMIGATDVALRKANLKRSDLDWLIPHQANKRIIDAAAKYLEMPEEKVIVNIA
ncbi:MAG TPA: beta-ketoacyl-ACP synthase III, partial [Candidatus Rubrimentiphilum sp.]|nr:beta-ketoacyl-ACP synthase III [Candidatus Rubrimentiphilum sp.]